MFSEKKLKDNRRRSFQITIGLTEGYNTGIDHTSQEVIDLIGEWMKQRMVNSQPCITGGILVPGTMVYAWNSEATGVQVNQENSVLFVGEVNPLYCGHFTDHQVVVDLKDLAAFIGERLNQTRMYVTYMDNIFILQNDKTTHPTERPLVLNQ